MTNSKVQSHFTVVFIIIINIRKVSLKILSAFCLHLIILFQYYISEGSREKITQSTFCKFSDDCAICYIETRTIHGNLQIMTKLEVISWKRRLVTDIKMEERWKFFEKTLLVIRIKGTEWWKSTFLRKSRKNN